MIKSLDDPQRSVRLGAASFVLVFMFVCATFGVASASAQQTQLEDVQSGTLERLGTLTEKSVPTDLSELAPQVLILAVLLTILMLIRAARIALFATHKQDASKPRNENGSSPSDAIERLLEMPKDILNTFTAVGLILQISIVLVLIEAATLWNGALSPTVGLAAALLSAGLLLAASEALPRLLARTWGYPIARAAAWPILSLHAVFIPAHALMNVIMKWLVALQRRIQKQRREQENQGELEAMIGASEVETLLEEDEREMIQGVFELSHTSAEQIMIPRTEMSALPDTLDQVEMIESLKAAKHNRILVYRENLDQIEGFLLAKEVLLNPATPWKEKLREVSRESVHIKLEDLLEHLRKARSKIALLVDDFGGIAGLVTMHDLLENIVGDIAEQHEKLDPELRAIGRRRWRVLGRTKLATLGQAIDTIFPDDQGETIGGFVMHIAGKVPSIGEHFFFQNLDLSVKRMIGRRIVEIEVKAFDSHKDAAGRDPELKQEGGT